MLFDMIPDVEKEMIKSYIKSNVGTPDVGLDKILAPWDNAKNAYLYKLLGNQFKVTKEIEFVEDEDKLFRKIADALYDNSTDMGKFRDNVWQAFVDNDNLTLEDAMVIAQLWGVESLASNAFTPDKVDEDHILHLKDGKTYNVQVGSKPCRALAKFAESYGVEGYEEFRLQHSLLLNQKKMKGKLVLSIHPLDFMTMSDNESDWSSCMSWRDEGCYRMGTVEMMNSDNVLVAYLEGSTPMEINGHDWDNKKWRNLVIVTNSFATTVKDYPYHSEQLCTEVMKMVHDLAKENLEREYTETPLNYSDGEYVTVSELNDKKIRIHFSTNNMYNDFPNGARPMGIFNTTLKDREDETIRYTHNYSGVSECMICGRTGFSMTDGLTCDDCNDDDYYTYCAICGERICRDDAFWSDEYDGYLCEDCHDDKYCNDFIYDTDELEDNMHAVYVGIKDEDNEWSVVTLNTFYTTCDEYFNINSSWRRGYFNTESEVYLEYVDGEYYLDARLLNDDGICHFAETWRDSATFNNIKNQISEIA